MHDDGEDPGVIEDDMDGLRSVLVGLYAVGGMRLVASSLTRMTWATIKGWFGKG